MKQKEKLNNQYHYFFLPLASAVCQSETTPAKKIKKNKNKFKNGASYQISKGGRIKE